jgi:hypothetical protein
MSHWFVGCEEKREPEEYLECSRGVFELGQVGVRCKGTAIIARVGLDSSEWKGLLIFPTPFMKTLAQFPLKFELEILKQKIRRK